MLSVATTHEVGTAGVAAVPSDALGQASLAALQALTQRVRAGGVGGGPTTLVERHGLLRLRGKFQTSRLPRQQFASK